jgi:hypothetical protein
MIRWLIAFACVFAFALSVSSFQAEAKAKRCVASNMDGKKISWKCKAKQKCCFDWFSNKGTCASECM